MDAQELCLKVEQAIQTLIPLSVTIVKHDGRLATIRIIAEAFGNMTLAIRITNVLNCLNTFDNSILKTFDLDFELLSTVESKAWGAGPSSVQEGSDYKAKIAARDAEV